MFVKLCPFRILYVCQRDLVAQASERAFVVHRVWKTVSLIDFLGGVSVCGLLRHAKLFPNLPCQGTSEVLHSALTTMLQESGIALNRVIGICTDGDSAMSGCQTGLVARMRESCGHIFAIHCPSHILNLVAKDGCDALSLSTEYTFGNVLRRLGGFFQGSILRVTSLNESQARKKKPVRRVPAFCDCRWSAVLEEVKFILLNWGSLKELFPPSMVQSSDECERTISDFLESRNRV